jgi:flagellar basal-body rod protein FlgC
MLNVLTGITNTSSALEAERIRMEVISQNINNAHVTRGADGLPYQRQQVVFETLLDQKSTDASGAANPTGIQVARIEKDQRAPRMVFEPGHKDADANGMVAYPDINIHEEMADLITAQRAFEANLAVVRNAKAMAMQTLAIGKR